MKKRVLLLNPPGSQKFLRDYFCSHSSKANYYWQPYDLFVLSGFLKDHFELSAIDSIIDNLSIDQTYDKIKQIQPDIIIFLTGAVSWNEDFEFIENLLMLLTKKPYVVGIGDILRAEPEEFLRKYPFLQAVLLNFINGENLVKLLIESPNAEEIKDIVYKKDGEIIFGEIDSSKNPFSLPTAVYELFSYEKYRIPHGRRIPFAGILTDYGCPFQCSYCIGGELGYRVRDVENSIAEMKYLKSIGIKELWFKNLTFAANRKHTVELLNRMLEEKFDFSWVCISRANVLDEPLLELMKKAGCHTIQLGVETSDEELLEKYSKGITPDQIKKVFDLCKKIGIRILGHFILGLPGDTEEKILKTIEYAKSLNPEFASFNVAMPRMGTKFREEAIEKGFISSEDNVLDNSISFPIIETETLSREKLWELRNKAIREYHLRPSYIISRILNIKTLYELQTLFIEGIAMLKTTLKRNG